MLQQPSCSLLESELDISFISKMDSISTEDITDFEKERELRVAAESYCNVLLFELESRELYLQELKNTLFKRVTDAELQMNRLIQMRNRETEEAKNVTQKLRINISRLQEQFKMDKSAMEQKINSIQDIHDGQIMELRKTLEKSEEARENLQNKIKKSEILVQDLNNQLNQSKKDLIDSIHRITNLTQINCELSNELVKSKSNAQKAAARADNSAKQLTELRKQAEQATASSVEIEKAARIASEKRCSAESALAASRQRADNLTNRINQLERELAQVKVRSEEQHDNDEKNVAKLKRRLIAVQGEASKWKRLWQEQKDAHNIDISKTSSLIETIMEEKSNLLKELDCIKQKFEEKTRQTELIQQQAAINASNASSRLLAALSTGEEGVATALELKQCIEQKLQPELESIKIQNKNLELQLSDAHLNCDNLRTQLNQANKQIDENKLILIEKQHVYALEMEKLQRQLIENKEQINVKSLLIKQAEQELKKSETALNELRSEQSNLRNSTDQERVSLIKEITELKISHENKDKELSSMQKVLTKFKSTRDSALNGLARIQVELKDTRDAYEEKLKSKMDECISLQNKLKQTEKKFDQMKCEQDKFLRESNNKFCFDQHIFEKMENKLNDQTKELQKFHDMEAKLRNIQTELSDTELQLKNALITQKSYANQIREKESQFNNIKQTVDERDREIEYLENELLQRSELLDKRCLELEELKETVEKQLLTNKTDAQNFLLQIQNLETQQQKLKTEKDNIEKDLCNIRIENEQLQQQILNLQNELSEKISELNQCKKSNEHLQNDLEQIQTKLNLQNKQCENSNHLIEQLVNEKQLYLLENEQIKQKCESLQNNLEKKTKNWEKCKQNYLDKIKNLTEQLNMNEQQLNNKQLDMIELENKLQLSNKKIREFAIETAAAKTMTHLTNSLLLDSNHNIMNKTDINFNNEYENENRLNFKNNSNNDKSIHSILKQTNKQTKLNSNENNVNLINQQNTVNFAPLPLLNRSDNRRPMISNSTNAISDLEELLRQVTSNLDEDHI